MTIDVYTATGTKNGTFELPAALFGAPVNRGLIHQALVAQQSNRRTNIAHVRTRGEVQGSTKKLYQQKGTGRARSGSVRSPLRRGGGKIFGPRNDRNFIKDMPKMMRRAALISCLSLRAREEGTLLAIEGYPSTIKTKDFTALLGKLPVQQGRRILFVLPEKHESLTLSCRNVPGVRTVLASYLNPEDVLVSHRIIFLGDSIAKAEQIFSARKVVVKPTVDEAAEFSVEKKAAKVKAGKVNKPAKPAKKAPKKASAKKA